MLFFLARFRVNKNIVVNRVVYKTPEALPRLNQNAGFVLFVASFAAKFLQDFFEVCPAQISFELRTIINIIQNRFDGIDYSGDGKVMVVLMNSNTIKSAIANTGEYSLDNNDIMFQISEVTQNQMIPSQLYEQLRQQPFVDSEQALEAYKNVYTDSVGDWQSTEFNC